MKIGRNSMCSCGSGKKYKKCCLILECEPVQMFEILPDMHEVCSKALAQINAGDLLNAEREAERLYDLHPDDHMVNFLQGICCIKRECDQKAISFFEKAIEINPWFCEAYFNLAGLYLKEMKTRQSAACFRKIIEIEGKHGDLGKLAKKELDRLEKVLQKTSGQTLEEYLQGSILFDEAFACLRSQNYTEAIALFQKHLALDPNHVQSYGNIALAYSALGEQKIALQYLDKALLLDPTYELAQQNREIISRLKEGQKNPLEMKEVLYYEERLKSKRCEGSKA